MRPIIVLLATMFALAALAHAEEKAAYAPMAPFATMVGKTWRGEGNGPDGAPITDVAFYEYILGGRALQATHRLEGGTYGGRTIFFFDEGAQEYVFHYFTTAGFHTTGEIRLIESGFESVEKVIGHPEVVEVRSKVIFEGDTIRMESSHIDKAGETSVGDGFVYRMVGGPEAFVGFSADGTSE